MLWLKRNWLLLVMILAALGLLAGAIAYLVTQIQADAKAAKSLKEAQDELVRLRGFTPSLDDQNIQKVKGEIQWFKQYVPQVEKLLVASEPPKLDNASFKSLLENTIAELNAQAESAGVTVKARYSFTFEEQRKMTYFTNSTIPVMATQLAEIKELCQILFRSKIHSLDSLKRVRAYSQEQAGSPDYIDTKSILTNGSVTITPYEVVFRGFTAELSAVLDALQRSPVFFTVKRVTVVPIAVQQPVTLVEPAATKPTGPKKPGAPAPPAQPVVQTIVDERPLQITLALEVVKQLPQAAPAQATAPAQPANP